jgi:chemotaxis protein MotC
MTRRWLAIVAVAASAFVPVKAQAMEAGPTPLSMVRSLQFVQDAVIKGDHSAIEMQRHLLTVIDERLRAASAETFYDQHGMDAAIIYALSGGNPATLPMLARRFPEAGFDPRLMPLLEEHLRGRGRGVFEPLRDILVHYQGTRIEPYLTLVAANAAALSSPADSLPLFDWARLLAPGSIIEEAALRRSVEVSVRLGMVDEGLKRAERYARRFLHSPYAGQFADLFVELVLSHPDDVKSERIAETLAFMDEARQRSIYLRIARRAAINGNRTLAQEAAAAAEGLGVQDEKAQALANLYSGAAAIPGEDVSGVAAAVSSIDDAALSPRDRALRSAAESIAAAVTRPPILEAIAEPVAVSVEPDASSVPDTVQPPMMPVGEDAPETTDAPSDAVKDEVDGFVDDRRAVLESIDALLEEDR